MKIQNLFNLLNIRILSALISASLISSCAYESHPASSSNSNPYNRSNNNSIAAPLIVGATAIGALAYIGSKHKNHRRSKQHHRNCHSNYHRDYAYNRHRSYRYDSSRPRRTPHHYRNDRRHSRDHYRSNRHHRNEVRNSYRNNARDALRRKRDSQY